MKFLKQICAFVFISALPSLSVAVTMCWSDLTIDPSKFVTAQAVAFCVGLLATTYPYE